MKNLSIFLIAFCSLLFITCEEGAYGLDPCDRTCGLSGIVSESITLNTLTQSNSSQGIAKYIWYTEFAEACSSDDAFAFLSLYLIEKFKVVPVEVHFHALIGSHTIPLTIEPVKTSLRTEYSSSVPIRLKDFISDCSGSIRLRLQINFERFPTRDLNDAFIKDVIDPRAIFQLDYSHSK